MYKRTDMFDLGLKRIIIFDLLFNFFARVDDRRMVAATEFLPDRRYDTLNSSRRMYMMICARLYYLLLARFLVDTLLGDLVVSGDSMHDLLDGNTLIWLHSYASRVHAHRPARRPSPLTATCRRSY